MTTLQVVQKFYPKVKKVIDASKPIRVEVTQADVKKSTQRDHSECALAQACRRSFKADGMVIAIKTAYIIKGTKAVRFSMSEAASREITSFDRNGGFEPGVYNLERCYQQKKGRPNSKKAPEERREYKRKIAPAHRTTNIRAAIGGK